jgi:integrase
MQLPANDELFDTPKVRNALVRSSFYPIENLPKSMAVFRVAGEKFWFMRYFVYGSYVHKVLDATDLEAATFKAQQFYRQHLAVNDFSVAKEQHIKAEIFTQPMADESVLMRELIHELLDHEMSRVARDELKYNSFLIHKGRLEGFIFEYFSKRQLNLIDANVMESFVNFLTRKNLSGPTIKGYLAICMRLLRLMHRKKIIGQIPLLPNVKASYKPRGAFTLTEYRAIVRKARELRGQRFEQWGEGKRIWIRPQYQVMPDEMELLIRFMIYTFMRPGDVRQLKHKHIEVVRNKFTYLRLTLPEVKRHQAPVVSLPAAVPLYERIKAMGLEKGFGQPEDPVFMPDEKDRTVALNFLGWLFNWILNDLGLKTGPHGAERSLYSLRHTAITFRLLYGGKVDLLTLAKNSRTSVEMIEKFYASTLSAEANVALLHAKRFV